MNSMVPNLILSMRGRQAKAQFCTQRFQGVLAEEVEVKALAVKVEVEAAAKAEIEALAAKVEAQVLTAKVEAEALAVEAEAFLAVQSDFPFQEKYPVADHESVTEVQVHHQ